MLFLNLMSGLVTGFGEKNDDDRLGLTTWLGSYGLRYAVARLDSTLTAS